MLKCMKLYLFGHDHKYAVEQVLLMLFPAERPEYPETPTGEDRAEVSLFKGEKRLTAVCRLYLRGECHMGRAAVSREDVVAQETDSLLTRAYQGSLGLMLSAMVSSKRLTKSDIDELYAILKEAEEGSE